MDAIRQELTTLSKEELQDRMKSCGLKPIAITKTTRSLVERRIAKCLWEQEGGGAKEDPTQTLQNEARESQDATDHGSALKLDQGSSPADAVSAQVENSSKSQSDLGGRSETEPPVNYFAVCIPSKTETGMGGRDEMDSSYTLGNTDEILIFQDRKEALRVAKRNKGARFKVFKTQEEASDFARSNQDLITPKPSTEPTVCQPALADKLASNFRSVKTQDLVLLRKTIERNEVMKVKEIVWSNPRYLINTGDCPTILQEGSRYNALHVAAKFDRPEICTLLLETIGDPAFILLMYPDDAEDIVASRVDYLSDLYLNSPDKGSSETPLHFASKLGHVEVAELLVNHPKCDKTLKNKQGQTAGEIVCSWSTLTGNPLKQLKQAVNHILQDHSFVPVYRAEDNCTQPVIGEPWSPDLSEHQSSPLFHTRPAAESPIESVLSLSAFAGPMSPAEAECFRRNLQTPPSTERKRVRRIKRADSEKGVERIARDLAGKMKVSWAEYWSFLNAFVDIASPNGLDKLEQYLAENCISNEESSKHGVAVEEGRVVSHDQNETVIKDLAGDFGRLSIGFSKEEEGVTNGNGTETAELGSSGKRNQPSAGTKTDETLEAIECEPETEDMSRDGVERVNALEDADADTVVNHQATNRRRNDDAPIITQKVEEDHDQPRDPCPDLGKKSGNPSAEQQQRDSLSCAIQRTEEESLIRPSSDAPKSSGVDDRVINSLITSCQSEISMQSRKTQASDGTSVQNTDSCLALGGETGQLGLDASATVTAQAENSSAVESCESRKCNGHSQLGDGPSLPWTPTKDSRRQEHWNPASGDQSKDGEMTASSVAGNGDRKTEIFKTPRMSSSNRTDCSLQDEAQEIISFILGSCPTKTDLHVWRALAEAEVPDKYPCIRRWKQLIGSIPGETRDRWPTPARGTPTAVRHSHISQTPSPRHLHNGGFGGLFDGSPLGLRARHFSEPTHRIREPAGGLRLRQAGRDITEPLGEPKARLFQE